MIIRDNNSDNPSIIFIRYMINIVSLYDYKIYDYKRIY